MRDGWSRITVRLEAPDEDIARVLSEDVLSLGSVSSSRGSVLLIPIDTGGDGRLQEHLSVVHDFLTLHESALLRASESCSADVFIGWSPSAPQESLTLDSSLLAVLASLKMDLVFDTYGE